MLYRAKVYSVKQDHSLEYLADGLIKKSLLGNAMDAIDNNYSYAQITEEPTGKIKGIDEKKLHQDGEVLAVFKNDLTKENEASPTFTEVYLQTIDINPITLHQQEILQNRRRNLKGASK